MSIVNNVGLIFTGFYWHYRDVPKETMFERHIDERTKLRKERFDETKRKKKKINDALFKAYFTLLSKPK